MEKLVWRQAAGLVHPEELPALAADALVRGVDSSALRELAGLNRRSDTEEILELYRTAIAELGITRPSSQEAVRWWLRELAADLLAGRITVEQLTARAMPAEDWMTEQEANFAVLGYYWEEGWADGLRAAAEAVLRESDTVE